MINESELIIMDSDLGHLCFNELETISSQLADFMENFENWQVVSATLIIYGIAFIIIEKLNKRTTVTEMSEMTYKKAILIGMFQVLSIVPGTSRSGSTILGGMILGTSRSVAAEFSFFLAIPVMFGVITTENIEQAIERAGTKAGNKGFDCATGAIEMVNLIRSMENK